MIKIIQAKSAEDCEICDSFLTKLIRYESKLDKTIAKDFVVNGMAKNCILNDENYFAYAVKDKIPVGYIYGFVKERKGKVCLTNNLMIDAVFVDSEFRTQGVGRKLIESFEDWAESKFDKDFVVEITYLNSNEKAKKFYESLGFKPVKTILRK